MKKVTTILGLVFMASTAFAGNASLQSQVDQLAAKGQISDAEYSVLTTTVQNQNAEVKVQTLTEFKKALRAKAEQLFSEGKISGGERSVLLEMIK